MAKDKKKKKKDKGGKPSRVTSALDALSNNRLVADIVATALVATASALKDSKKAKALAASAGDELEALAKEGAERGNAMWKLALEVGRRALDTLVSEDAKPAKTPKAPKAPKAPRAPRAAKSAKVVRPAKSSPKAGRKPK